MRKETKCTLREARARLLATRPTPVDVYRNVASGLNPNRDALLVEWDRDDIGMRGAAVTVMDARGFATEVINWEQRK